MRKMILQCGALALSLLAANVMAAVSPQEADKLGTTLTPLGAEKAGNADGSIPAWTGGIPKNAGAVDSKGFLADPFASEKPLFTITAANVDKYKAKLSDGQVAMFKRYPETYRIPVYPTHRTVAVPPEIYESAKRSALNVTSINDGNGLANFTGNRYYAFRFRRAGSRCCGTTSPVTTAATSNASSPRSHRRPTVPTRRFALKKKSPYPS